MKQQSDTKSKSLESNFPFHPKRTPPPPFPGFFKGDIFITTCITHGGFLKSSAKKSQRKIINQVIAEVCGNGTKLQLHPVVVASCNAGSNRVAQGSPRSKVPPGCWMVSSSGLFVASVCNQWLVKMFLAVLIRICSQKVETQST